MPERVVAFNVPKTTREIARVQVDEEKHFYDKLHQHPEIQIMLIEAGEGTLIAGDFVGRFVAGELYVIGSQQPHVFRSDPVYYGKRSPGVRSLSLYFNEDYFGKELWNARELAGLRKMADDARQCYKVISPQAEQAVAMVRLLDNQEGLRKIVSFFSLLDLLIQTPDKKYLSIQPSTLTSNEAGRMSDIVEFTFRESHRKIYLKEIAQCAHLSVEAFCRYFKLHTRKTYITFLNEVRISNACQLLIQKDLSIQEVCYQTGFNNVSNFNRIFRKVTGKTPLGWRRQLPFRK